MDKMKHIVKRLGHEELFDEKKVYASCYAACLSSHIKHVEAEKISEKVCRDVKKWMKDKKRVTSTQIFKETGRALKKYDKNASFMYLTHRDIS